MGNVFIMKRLLIAGAGGFGREALAWALACPSNRTEWRVGGFLDANPSALEGFDIDFPLVGAPESYEPREDDVFICAIGDPATKLRVALDLKSRGARFVNVIHPTAIIGPNSRMGTGCILCPNCMVTTNVVLGDFVTLNLAATGVLQRCFRAAFSFRKGPPVFFPVVRMVDFFRLCYRPAHVGP
jgi:hypothetical protein